MRSSIFSVNKPPRLTLVGAGPGDPELLTLRAVRALKEADLVLFDALVSDRILAMIPSGIPVFNVGKRAGAHSCTQEQINELIVEFAHLYGHVVRLKGGDPFVFARGGEEMEYAIRHGVATGMIPGISSALAVPASGNIPLTVRNMSESFWVVTGTTKDGTLSGDISLAAQSTATVVVLMGMNKLEEIMAVFTRHGKGSTGAAVIQNGTLPEQQSVKGTVSTLAALAKERGIGSPAVIVVGDVVRFASQLDHAHPAVRTSNVSMPTHGRVA